VKEGEPWFGNGGDLSRMRRQLDTSGEVVGFVVSLKVRGLKGVQIWVVVGADDAVVARRVIIIVIVVVVVVSCILPRG